MLDSRDLAHDVPPKIGQSLLLKNMKFYGLILGILAVWRVAHLFNAEDGPWEIIVRLRQRAGSGFWGDLLDCFYCLSLWISLPLAWLIGEARGERLLLWPALSAGAIVIDRLTPERPEPGAAHWYEHEVHHGMLRQGEKPPNGCDEETRSTEIKN